MKWTSRKPTRVDYSKIALALFIVALVALFVMLLSLLAPRPATAGDITNFRTARRLAAVVIPLDKVTTRSSEPIAILICEITAYSPTVAECDTSPLVTASGKRVYVGGIAADLRVLPFGSIVIIPGYNNGDLCTVIDTGGAIRGQKLDVFFWHTQDAVKWGRRRNVQVQVLYIPERKP
jgi:3D (Asp-Asp-Asp) domain-containing protein